MSSIVPCAPSNRIDSPLFSAWFSRTAVSATKGAIFSAACAYSVYILSASRGSVLKSACAIIFFFADRILDVLLEQLQVEQIGYAQAAAAHLVFVCRANATRCGA